MRCHRVLISTLVLALAACGGSSSDPFGGCWTGPSTVTMASGDPVPTWLDNSVLADAGNIGAAALEIEKVTRGAIPARWWISKSPR